MSQGRASCTTSAVTDLAEHDQLSAAILAEIVAENLSPEVNAAVEDITPAVEAYLASADSRSSRRPARNPAAARAAYADFASRVQRARGEMPTLGEAVEAYAEAGAAHSRASGRPRSRSR